MANNYKKENGRNISMHLNVFLANTAVVYYKTHGFHWNVKGAEFYSMHIMLEKFSTKLWKSMDETAERIRTLGERVPQSYRDLLPMATISENETAPQIERIAQILRNDYIELADNALKIAEIATEYEDLVTNDMMIQRAAFLQKAAWMLHSVFND